MAHGGYGKRRVAGRPPTSGARNTTSSSSRGVGVRHNKESEKKAKMVSIKNQIRSVERLLRKTLPVEMKDAQQKRLEDLKKQAELHQRTDLERKMAMRYRKVKFFERRKIERGIRRLEKLQRAASDNLGEEMGRQIADITQQLAHLKEDLEYVRFFPKTEKYVSLFMGNDDDEVIAKRNKLREQIKANLAAAAASGVELEETGSEDDGAMEVTDDDFFLAGSSSDDADADDEWTDKSSRPGDDRDDTSRELVPSSSRVTLGHRNRQQHQRLSNLGLGSQVHGQRPQSTGGDHKNKKQKTTIVLMPPPSRPSSSNSGGFQARSRPSSSISSKMASSGLSSSNSAGFGRIGNRPSSSNGSDIVKATPTVGSSNSDAQQKRHRKRRPKKKKK